MPRRRNERTGELPLPAGWEMATDYDGKLFFIDHTNQKTSWIDPRDRFTKPQTFADCVGDELPVGWEEAYDPHVGVYYINHNTQTNQVEDPRLLWREEQHAMLKDYLVVANDDLNAKREIYTVIQQRLAIAQEEVQHLNDTLAHWKASRTSLCSVSSSASSTKYDPDLLKADVALARNRVQRLKWELKQIHEEVAVKQHGVDRLTQVNQKMEEQQYNVNQAQEILTRIRCNQKSLCLGEKEKRELMQSLARLKEEFVTNKLNNGGSSPDISMLSLASERLSTASQTDLSGESAAYNNAWGEMVRLRYDEARKQVTRLQEELMHIEDQMIPGQNESDKDRLLLIQEKEQLLRELRAINPSGRSEEELRDIRLRITQLEKDLVQAMEHSHKQIAERLKLNDQKSVILQQLGEATRLTTYLESQLHSLSTSTLSMSSGSSRGSLGSLSGSSKSSLASLSISDIYLGSQMPVPDTNLNDLHRRVEKLLQGHSITPIHEVTASMENVESSHASSAYLSHGSTDSLGKSIESSLTSLSPPASPHNFGAPPSYEQHLQRQYPSTAPSGGKQLALEEQISELSLLQQNQPPHLHLAPLTNISKPTCPENLPVVRPAYAVDSCFDTPVSNPPLSPISETSSGVGNALSGGNTRSVSAAVSDESVAGDSGVFEASIKRCSELDEVFEMALESAQVQIQLKYDGVDGKLLIGIEQARNLAALAMPDVGQVCIKAAILPTVQGCSIPFCTKLATELNAPKFNEIFKLSVLESKLASKTLQVHVFCVSTDGTEDCMGCAQVSLADFDPAQVSRVWYNVLSFHFMQSDGRRKPVTPVTTTAAAAAPPPPPPPAVTPTPDKVAQLLEASSVRLRSASFGGEGQQAADQPRDTRVHSSSFDSSFYRSGSTGISCVKEESSDESTIISSQTSTLTRNQGPDDMEIHQGFLGESAANHVEEDEEEEEEEDEEEEVDQAKDVEEEDDEDVLTETEDEVDVEADNEQDSSMILTDDPDDDDDTELCDKETNTDVKYRLKKREAAGNSGVSIRRSQTFSPSGRPGTDYICKLNRSDSDSSVKYRRGTFERNASERRSLRLKRNGSIERGAMQSTPLSCAMRTSIDLELDLQASEVKLCQQRGDITRLKEIKRLMEQAKASGGGELPSWFENEQIQLVLEQAEKLRNKRDAGKRTASSRLDERAERRLRKVTKEIYRLRNNQKRQQPDANTFREKMAFFTTTNRTIPIIPGESDSDMDSVSDQSTLDSDTLTKAVELGPTVLTEETVSEEVQLERGAERICPPSHVESNNQTLTTDITSDSNSIISRLWRDSSLQMPGKTLLLSSSEGSSVASSHRSDMLPSTTSKSISVSSVPPPPLPVVTVTSSSAESQTEVMHPISEV